MGGAPHVNSPQYMLAVTVTSDRGLLDSITTSTMKLLQHSPAEWPVLP